MDMMPVGSISRHRGYTNNLCKPLLVRSASCERILCREKMETSGTSRDQKAVGEAAQEEAIRR